MSIRKTLAKYIRLSREDENEGESGSIINQRELLNAFVKNSPDLSQYEVVEFCDDGYSGTNFDRPGVNALLDEVRAGNIQCILVKDLSRFGRSYIDMGDYLEQIFPFLGVRFLSVNDRFDSNDFDGATVGLDVEFRNLIYSLYSKDLSQKVRSAKKTRMEKGEFIGSHAPYGYAKSPKNRKKLVVDETAAAVVRRIFSMADEGKNAVRIAAILNAESIPTPYAYKLLMGCDRKYNVVGQTNHWMNKTVLTILHDERYTGNMVNGKNRSPFVGSKHGKRTPKSEWIVVPNTHEAIVSEELFASVQARFSAPARIRAEPAEVSPLTGKVKCGVCGHVMRRSKSTPAAAYYYCESHQYVADSACTKDRISEASLMQTVLSVIQKQIELLVDMEPLFDQVSTQSHKDVSTLTGQLRRLQAVLAKRRASKVTVYERYRAGALGKDGYRGQTAEIGKEIAETEAQIAALETALHRHYQEDGQPCPITRSFQRQEGFTALTRELADALIDSIYLYGSEAVELVWNHMDEYMSFVQGFS